MAFYRREKDTRILHYKSTRNRKVHFNKGTGRERLIKSMSEMSEIDQVHLRAVMLFMSEMSEIVIIFNIHSV